MTTREALNAVHADGVPLTIWELRGMVERGEVPRPRLNSALMWDWTPADLVRLTRAARERQRKNAAEVVPA